MPDQDKLFQQAIDAYGPALARLARACELGGEERRDLLQEIHLALWRSFAVYDARCSLRTWVYRVAHNAAASHILRSRRFKAMKMVSLEELEAQGGIADRDANDGMERSDEMERLLALTQRLNPLDRQVILLYLEGLDGASIGEVTGISAGYAATKVCRIKGILVEMFRNGGNHDQQ